MRISNKKADYVKALTWENDLKKTLLSPKEDVPFFSSRTLRFLPRVPAKFALKKYKKEMFVDKFAISPVPNEKFVRFNLVPLIVSLH